MRTLSLTLFILLLSVTHSFPYGAVYCKQIGEIDCAASGNASTIDEAQAEAKKDCEKSFGPCDFYAVIYEGCYSLAVSNHTRQIKVARRLGLPWRATQAALQECYASFGQCSSVVTACEGSTGTGYWPADKRTYPVKSPYPDDEPEPSNSLHDYLLVNGYLATETYFASSNTPFFNLGAVGTGISFGLGIIIALLIYAARGPIINFVIHGNLPYKLPVYGEDIQCLFKRTQRVNWYGRVVFGIVVNLAMTHQQLIDVRKYWLGRVIAFDSLRRQRQNELARMHLQLAANVKSDAKDTKPISQLLAALKAIFLVVFYLFRAVFSFLFGFLFIRITIAKLVQGTIIESTDLVLILQAKDAIEQTTTYLKEYLTTANTFDGGDEIYEPQ